MLGKLRAGACAPYPSYRDPWAPWYAKLVAAVAVGPLGYILVFGYLDGMVLVPLGSALAAHTIPEGVLAGCREEAREVAAPSVLLAARRP